MGSARTVEKFLSQSLVKVNTIKDSKPIVPFAWLSATNIAPRPSTLSPKSHCFAWLYKSLYIFYQSLDEMVFELGGV